MKKYQFAADPFARAFLESRDQTMPERIAAGLLEAAHYLPIDIPENCMLPTVSTTAPDSGVSYYFGNGICYNPWVYDDIIKKYPEHAEEIQDIREQMARFNTNAIVNRSCSWEDLNLYEKRVCWGGGWGGHGNPDYDRYLHLGTNGIRALIEKQRAENPGKDAFYNACRTAMDSLDVLAGRIVKIAADKAKNEKDAEKRAEYLKISETFTRVPMEPAYDIYSAIMMFWMYFTQDGVDSPGRFDQFMADYYDISGEEETRKMVRRFLEGMHNVRGWNLCISGSDENRNDETNGVSYIMLDLVTEMKYQTPNLTMRTHRNTPQKLWEMAAKCIGQGMGIPAIYNDEVVCPALESIGIPPADSHDYCMNGCNQIDIMGKSHMGLEDGEVNLGKVLELVLHRGYDFKSNGGKDLITHQFGEPTACKTFDEFMTLYYRGLDYITDCSVRMANTSQEVYANYAPNPMRSCLIQGCLEKGKDYRCGGPLYGHGQVLAEGIADAVDSMWAIKTLVYDRKKYTMEQLIEALEADYKGYDDLHRDFSNCEKFGNDIPDLDEFCADVVDHFFRYLKTKHTYRGGIYTGGCSPFDRASMNGEAVAALPNGKTAENHNYADSIAATPGCDVNGPTAAIKSMMHYRQKEAGSGFVTQMKFDKTVFNTKKGLASFVELVKVYFANGGQQVSVNVLDRKTLLAAQKNPEQYRDLVVRVGGYSDYFCNISPDLQQNVIDRTSFDV